MKMKKRCRSMIAALIVLCTFMTTLSMSVAAEGVSVQPRLTAVVDMQAGLSMTSGGRADCTGRVEFENGYSGNLTVKLQRSTNQVIWTDVKTWTASGSDTVGLDKSYYVSSGYYYRVEVTVDAYNAAGVFIETVSAYSSKIKY